MNSSGDDSDDKVVINTMELEFTSPLPKRHTSVPTDEMPVRARGTREQLPLTYPVDARARGAESARDPLEVLRTWPHSSGAAADPSVPSRATLPAPSAKRVYEDKILLAHLALDLFREVDELHEATRDARPGRPDAVVVCENPSCAARTSALRGAVVEACLLVQRAVLMTPPSSTKTEIETSVRGLLGRIGR